MACPICNHASRAEIEQELLCRSLGDLEVTLEQIASKYGVRVVDLQVHAMMHDTLDIRSEDGRAHSIVTEIKFKEADVLRDTLFEYQRTLMLLGARVRGALAADGETVLLRINKATADLYVGIGGEIRATVDTLVHMNAAVNGDPNSGANGLHELCAAIRDSHTT